MSKLTRAMTYAAVVHHGDVRKGTRVPYLTHLVDVCERVAAMGGRRPAQIAALLHDVVEDHGPGHLVMIESEFGARVARIVELCSDSTTRPKPPWRDRKVAYIRRVNNHVDDADYLCVTLADKLANASDIARDHHTIGDDIYDRFANSGADQAERKRNTLSYYADLARVFTAADLAGPMAAAAEELATIVAKLGATDAHTLRT